ncbi:MAG: hypothetical protein WC511_01890 [Candidatus Pacearchaeota archaeon]
MHKTSFKSRYDSLKKIVFPGVKLTKQTIGFFKQFVQWTLDKDPNMKGRSARELIEQYQKEVPNALFPSNKLAIVAEAYEKNTGANMNVIKRIATQYNLFPTTLAQTADRLIPRTRTPQDWERLARFIVWRNHKFPGIAAKDKNSMSLWRKFIAEDSSLAITADMLKPLQKRTRVENLCNILTKHGINVGVYRHVLQTLKRDVKNFIRPQNEKSAEMICCFIHYVATNWGYPLSGSMKWSVLWNKYLVEHDARKYPGSNPTQAEKLPVQPILPQKDVNLPRTSADAMQEATRLQEKVQELHKDHALQLSEMRKKINALQKDYNKALASAIKQDENLQEMTRERDNFRCENTSIRNRFNVENEQLRSANRQFQVDLLNMSKVLNQKTKECEELRKTTTEEYLIFEAFVKDLQTSFGIADLWALSKVIQKHPILKKES